MNRRSFITSILTACAGPLILPSATTYKRLWRPKRLVWRCNTLGIYEQLKQCEHIYQMTGPQTIDIDALFGRAYLRLRQAQANASIEMIVHKDSIPSLLSLL